MYVEHIARFVEELQQILGRVLLDSEMCFSLRKCCLRLKPIILDASADNTGLCTACPQSFRAWTNGNLKKSH